MNKLFVLLKSWWHSEWELWFTFIFFIWMLRILIIHFMEMSVIKFISNILFSMQNYILKDSSSKNMKWLSHRKFCFLCLVNSLKIWDPYREASRRKKSDQIRKIHFTFRYIFKFIFSLDTRILKDSNTTCLMWKRYWGYFKRQWAARKICNKSKCIIYF